MRAVGLDVHLEFCEVAISEEGEVRSAGRIENKPERIELFAESLGAEDRVALEVTGNAWEIAWLIEPHVARVVVVCPSDTGIRQARAKTDRLDARTLAKLLASGELDAVWVPDRETWVMRRRLARRGQLVWGRSRAKNQIDPEWRDSDGPSVHKSRSAPGGSSIVGGSGRGGSFGRFCHLSRHVPLAPGAARSLKASSSSESAPNAPRSRVCAALGGASALSRAARSAERNRQLPQKARPRDRRQALTCDARPIFGSRVSTAASCFSCGR